MEPDSGIAITNPAIVLIGLASLAAIAAALQWRIVFKHAESIHTPEGGQGRRALKDAALFTAFALGLASVGFLLGRLTGSV